VTFTPAPDFVGDAEVVYTVTDGNGLTDTATLVVTVSDVIGPIDGTDNPDDMTPGYTDAEGDEIDGPDGLNDTIFGNGGDDTIDSGEGDDTVDGGDGDDVFVITDTGEGIDNDEIIGGEGDEDDGGDVIDLSDIDDDLTVDITDPEEGTITDGTDTTTFEEIEQVVTGSGDDTITGSDGDDNVDGGDGDDSIDGDDGDDTLDGGDGENTIDGGDGDDSITGGDDNDTITGGDGNDTVDAGDGDNVVDTSGPLNLVDDKNGDGFGFAPYGPFPAAPADADENDDRDSVTTGDGNDSITTGDDDDTIVSGGGDDTIDTGIDDDSVDAGAGNDLVTTGEGADTVDGGLGDDTIYGGLGPNFPATTDIPDDGSALFGPDPDPENGRDLLDGGEGDDLIFGEDDDDTLIGGIGNDSLDGGIDDDDLSGGEGEDVLTGGQGSDTMSGGDDADTFVIEEREDAFGDVIDGGTGGDDNDTLDLTGLGRVKLLDTDGVTPLDLTTPNDADGDSFSGVVQFLDDDGNVEGTLNFSEIENIVPCFTPGSLIATPRGEVLVEDLQVGDRVITRDDGIQEIEWIGKKKISGQDMKQDPKLRPVMIRKGSLGNGLPERDMLVSPNHRMLVANEDTQMLFEEREVLVAAKHLVGHEGIHQVDLMGTEYIHVMFDRHQVILGDGAWTESFQPGDQTLGGFDKDQLEELFKLFPSLASNTGRKAYASARQSLKAYEAKTLRGSMGRK
jgi:Ca2+-binding RTX toxin-like protein